VDVEAVVAQRPDLIIGTSNGADAITDTYDELAAIAPTLMIDPSGSSWDEVATELAAAIGKEAQAAAAIETFDGLVADARTAIGTPAFPAGAMVYTPENINVFTPVSAHGRLLQQLGFEVVDPGTSGQVEGGNRSDVTSVSLELLPGIVRDATVFLVFADDSTLAKFVATPVIAATPAPPGEGCTRSASTPSGSTTTAPAQSWSALQGSSEPDG
jgi:iron complex transport system substrate-binding protein